MFSAHRVVTAAAVRASASSPELRGAVVHARWSAGSGSAPRSSRPSGRRGAAPAGLPARDLAVALNLMNERVLAATFTGEQPVVAEDAVVDVLLAVWLPSIYGTRTPRPTAPLARRVRSPTP